MKGMFLVLLLVLSTPVLAELSILDADKATIELSISSNIAFIGENSRSSVTEASAELSWFPRNTYNQKVKTLTTTPEADISDLITFSWKNPPLTKSNLVVQSVINTNNGVTPVIDKPPFPLVGVDPDLTRYIEPSEMIDINQDIRDLASELAAGKEDQYEIVFALADWVTTNIDYNLSTLTADAVFPSSWVLEKGYGVCDELTNLFISMARSLGMPARFVSGLAYTEMEEFDTNWVGHGWAEVYFPGVGWVPFDVTFGEYGYIDAGHIKLKDSIDSKETSIEFRATGYDFSIQSQPLDFDVKVLSSEERNYEFLEAELTAFADEVRFGSYNLLTLRLKNLREYYVSTRVDLGQTTRMRHVSPDNQNILLKPYEERKFYFLVKVDDDLDPQFLYTFPIIAYTKLGDPTEVSFKATADAPLFDEDAFTQFFTSKPRKEAAVDIVCTVPTPVKEVAEVTCEFKNKGVRVSGMVCIDKNCKAITLRDAFTLKENFTREPGIYTFPASFSNKNVRATQFVTVHLLDETKVEIRDIQFPETIRFGEEGVLSFTVVRTSASAPVRNKVSIAHDFFKQEWEQEQFLTTGTYELRFTGDRLRAGENNITFTVEYQDSFGEWRTTSQERTVTLVDVTLGQRVQLWLNSIDRWVQGALAWVIH